MLLKNIKTNALGVSDCWWRAVWRFRRKSNSNLWRSEPYLEEVKPAVNHFRSVLPVMTNNPRHKSEIVITLSIRGPV